MPAQRPAWRGQLRLSLVSIPVELFPAHKDERTHFRQIHKSSGQPIQYQKVVSGLGAVDPADIVKGYEHEKGDFVLLRDEELDAVRLETKKTLDLAQFVSIDEISPIYFEKAYFVVPQDELAEDAFRVIRDALSSEGKAGIGQVTMRGHEYLVAVRASGNGMVLHTLRYEEEVRQPATVFSGLGDTDADVSLVAIAREIVDRSTTSFKPNVYRDRYQTALREMIASRIEQYAPRAKVEAPAAKGPAGTTNVIELMASLKKSLEAGGPAPASTTAARKVAAARKTKSAGLKKAS